jgi:hypothetical protein
MTGFRQTKEQRYEEYYDRITPPNSTAARAINPRLLVILIILI